MSDCFLIADEVGLGKTKSARTVLFEMIRLKNAQKDGQENQQKNQKDNNVHAIYIASNTELSEQNMKSEFLSKNPSVNQNDNYAGLAGFQKANAIKTLKVFWGTDGYSFSENDSSSNKQPFELKLDYIKDKHFTRLSDFVPGMCCDKSSYLIPLAPTTSFFVPSDKYDFGDEYKGSKDEREGLKAVFRDLYNKLDSNISLKENSLLFELIKAIDYDNIDIKKCANKEEKIKKIKALCYQIYSNIHSTKIETDATEFYKARRIKNNASAALYKPDLIILDEFQRYRQILKEVKDGYTICEMIKYLKDRYKNESYSPKVLLLSATPYNYNRKGMEPIQWGYGVKKEEDTYEAKTKLTELPFEDMDSLMQNMEILGAPSKAPNGTYKYSDYIARTERRMFEERNQNDESILIVRANNDCVKDYQIGYLNPIVKYCYEQDIFKKNDLDVIYSEIRENPEFWRFNYGYTKRTIISPETQIKLIKEGVRDDNYSVFDNMGLKQLEDVIFDKEFDLPRLWVPPVSTGKVGCGKTLVFTTMQVTTRSVSYFVNQMAIKKVQDFKFYDECSVCEETMKQYLMEDNRLEYYCTGNDLKEAIKKIVEFFNRSFVKRVIAAYIHKRKENGQALKYSEAVSAYCDNFGFWPMLEEFKSVLGNNYSVDRLLSAFSHQPASIIEWQIDESNRFIKKYTDIEYSEMFVCDDNKAGNKRKNKEVFAEKGPHKKCKSLNEICDQFNSPIYPMVLVARNAGQEGFNLQYYGDKLMHWQMAESVNAFLQREGRLDRPGSLVFREKVWQIVKDQNKINGDEGYANVKESFDAYLNGNYELCGISQDRFISGLSPLWNLNYKDIRIQQILPISEYIDAFDDFVKEIVAANQYSKFYENVRELCPFFEHKDCLKR